MGWSYMGANQMAQLRVLRANGVKVSQIHIEQSNRDKKHYIVDNIPKQTVATLSKAVGDSVETLGNIPSLDRGTSGWSPLLRRLANSTFDI